MNNGEIAKLRIAETKQSRLPYLDLSYLGLKEIPADISEMNYILDLNISHNNLTKFPSEISKLYNLLHLNISFNDITDIELEEGKFYSLKEFDFSNNLVSNIPSEIKYLQKTKILFENNPFLNDLPPEFYHTDDINYIAFYIESLKGRKINKRLFETKLLIVGKGDVGKTTLMKVLQSPNLEVKIGTEEPTHGINIRSIDENVLFPAKKPYYDKFTDVDNINERIESWDIDDEEDLEISPFDYFVPIANFNDNPEFLMDLRLMDEPYMYDSNYYFEKEVKINIWDFGGQEILYSTHQFFLTKRSIYILLWDSRTDNEEESFDYWLNVIRRLSDDSPVFVVMNKSDIGIKNVDIIGYMDKFPNIHSFHNVSCVTKEGIKNLRQDIRKVIRDLPHIGEVLPASWLEIRKKLSDSGKDYISLNEFREICNISDFENLKYLSGFLNDLGIIIHFYNDIRLKNLVILNSHWITKAVYELIHELEIQKNEGLFNIDQLENYLNLSLYPKDKHFEIILLMEKFEICFQLIGSQNKYIIPALLGPIPKDESIIDKFKIPESIKYQIRYDHKPSGIIERLICRLHNYLEKDNFWKYGAVFKTEYSKALVIFDKLNHKMDFYIIGKVSLILFNIMRHEIGNINSELKYDIEDYEEMLACNCSICSTKKSPFMFKKKVLSKFLNNSKYTIDCQDSTESVNIPEILGGYRLEKSRKQLIRDFIKAFGKFQNKHVALRKLDEDQRNSYLAEILKQHIRELSFLPLEQSRVGKSETGIREGEIDFTIEDFEGNQITFYEGFNLNSLDKSKILSHLKKSLLNYDAIGLDEKFIGVYCETPNFSVLSDKYLRYLETIKIKGIKILKTKDVSSIYTIGSEIKIYKTIYQRGSKKMIVYNILVNLNL